MENLNPKLAEALTDQLEKALDGKKLVIANVSPSKKKPHPFSFALDAMKQAIMDNLSDLEEGYSRRKWAISRDTGIPEDVLTVLLKQLKIEGKVRLTMVWCEWEGIPNGSGYCLTNSK